MSTSQPICSPDDLDRTALRLNQGFGETAIRGVSEGLSDGRKAE